MKICLCCSKKFFPVIGEFMAHRPIGGNEIFIPEINFNGEINLDSRRRLADLCHEKIRNSDAIYLYNPGGDIGKSTTLEMGYAVALNKKVFALEKVNDLGLDCFIEKTLSLNELVNNS